MAKTIPQLTDATMVNAADELIIQQGGVTKRATAGELMNSAPVTATGSTTARSLASRADDVVNVKDFGALGDGVADDSAAIQAAVNTNRPVFFPQGTYRTNTAITNGSGGSRRLIAAGVTFTGTAPVDTYPAFGEGSLKVYARGSSNSILGIAHNDLPSGTVSFPCGVTGYGRNDNAGNVAFGIYAEARQYANTGCVTNEINSFNHGSTATLALPPNRAFLTPEQHPIAITVAAGGTANSSIGIHVTKEGSSPQQFLTGIYYNPDSCVNYGLFLDSTSSSTYIPLTVKHAVSNIGIIVRGEGTPVANNAWLTYTDGANNSIFSIRQDGRLGFAESVTQTTVGINGAASALTANPAGYLKVLIGNFVKLIPYYHS